MRRDVQDRLRSKFPTVFGASELNVGDGWYSILEEAGAKYASLGVSVYEARSKLATLRIYTSSGRDTPEEVRKRVREIDAEAYHKSSTVCEDCGKPGATQSISGVLIVLCSACFPTARKRICPNGW
jgi:ribosomal protein L37AE/L43A